MNLECFGRSSLSIICGEYHGCIGNCMFNVVCPHSRCNYNTRLSLIRNCASPTKQIWKCCHDDHDNDDNQIRLLTLRFRHCISIVDYDWFSNLNIQSTEFDEDKFPLATSKLPAACSSLLACCCSVHFIRCSSASSDDGEKKRKKTGSFGPIISDGQTTSSCTTSTVHKVPHASMVFLYSLATTL